MLCVKKFYRVDLVAKNISFFVTPLENMPLKVVFIFEMQAFEAISEWL